jgi:hypothetical protein
VVLWLLAVIRLSLRSFYIVLFQLMEIVSSFGPLAAYRFLFNEYLGGACAFLEYIDHSITSKACAGLNGMKLGGGILTAVNVFPNSTEQVQTF